MTNKTPRALLLGCIAIALSATSLFAHAVVFPKAAEPGAYEKYVLRVPNERDVATTRVEITFPDSVKVVSFGDVPGWSLAVVLDSAKRIIGASWTGKLPPQRFIEFPFVAVNPKTPFRLVWPAVQTYADGEKVEWTGPEGADKPASVTMIGHAATTPNASVLSDTTAVMVPESGWTAAVAWGALLVAIIALGLGLRRR